MFDMICSIPHPSHHEQKLADAITKWAKERNLFVEQDETGNLLLRKAATLGMENRRGVVLQAHLDMVAQKNEDTVHDFENDPIQAYVDGDWVTAKGTTLGADNGIGMAACLAVLAADGIEHGPLEVLLTTNEEDGLEGAFGLEAGWLQGDILLNTDSESEGEVYMGCAGGIAATTELELAFEAPKAEQIALEIVINGLKGGHSGCDIHLGRGNASKLLARFLAEHLETEARLATITGGTLINAIPREAKATIVVAKDAQTDVEAALAKFQTIIAAELCVADAGVQSAVKAAEMPAQVLTAECHAKAVALINTSFDGVMRMSDDVEGVVESSLNLGMVFVCDNKLVLQNLIRSLIESGRIMVEGKLESLAKLAGANFTATGAYPGWKPNPESEVMKLFRDMYQKMYGKSANIQVIHAGLECGLFKKPYPNMDMISFGPTIKNPHSPDEKVNIATVALFWDQLVQMLKEIPAK
ncbi:aminoacyl-histidine dipeptidase [Vibrio sp. SCSIO 43136]|uniref:aminoacyl-histidine dipeptidase n=1 Tax=Vibrio sp. SCSIO 43136 TaxID=2819101 RepID=UPI0020761630|nr:aminoacyl-histidine dipeptidase [Vibrio sp. SCSIO 43136]